MRRYNPVRGDLMSKYLKPRILKDGTVIYPIRGWEPPPPMPGYRRKSNNPQCGDAWIFIPEWNSCKFRAEKKEKRANCQCIMLVHYCDHPKNQGNAINTQVCENCKLKND